MDHSTTSPFAHLLDEIREESAQRAASGLRVERARPARRRRPTAAPRRPRGEGAPEPDLRLEAGVVSGTAAGEQPPRWRWASSIVLHAAVGAAVVVLPLLRADDLPSPVSLTRAFFVQPSMSQPAPPPPPPAPRAAAARPTRSAASTPPRASLTAPPERPSEVKPEELPAPAAPALEPHADEGVPGGVEEGVPGGVVSGMIGGKAEPEPTAPSQVRVGIDVKEPRKIKDAAPVYPEVAARGNIEGVVLLELAIRPDGHVADVHVVRSIPLLDKAAMEAARRWVFTPTLFRGVPVGVTMTVSVRFSLKDA
jgi:periplasmic protein TonB